MQDRNLLHRIWDKFLDSVLGSQIEEKLVVDRSIGMSRLREQLWDLLDERSMEEGGSWAYPLDIFLGDDGSSLFSIVAQGGKLFEVPLTVTQDNLSLGDWTQVTEVFKPVAQSHFRVIQREDGTHRWVGIAGTTVLNRVAEIDSSELFDSFVKQAVENGKYPRLDFYHLGESDPSTWEFGTADYLARDGVCYIASGTFDENHPLAKAAIKACAETNDVWGHSIEFYAYKEPEIILIDPKIQVPIYKEGENTRISMVLEADAAGLFTRMIDVDKEKVRSMDAKIEEVLKKLFGDDTEALEGFVKNVDAVNQTVKNERLIHRAKKDEPVDSGEDDKDDDEEEDNESDEDDEVDEVDDKVVAQFIDLDEVAMKELVKQVSMSPAFTTLILPLVQSVSDVTAQVKELQIANADSTKEISRLKKSEAKLIEQVKTLSTDEAEKKQTWQQDLPARQHVQASYRPRDEHAQSEEDADNDLEQIANRTLQTIKNSY